MPERGVCTKDWVLPSANCFWSDRFEENEMSDILKKILATKHDEVAAARRVRSQVSLRSEAEDRREERRGFTSALRAKVEAGRAAVIAEVKKASPSKGVLRQDFDPAAIGGSGDTARSPHDPRR